MTSIESFQACPCWWWTPSKGLSDPVRVVFHPRCGIGACSPTHEPDARPRVTRGRTDASSVALCALDRGADQHRGCRQMSIGSPFGRPDPYQRRATCLTDGARSAIRRAGDVGASLGDPVGELALHRSGLAAGLAPELLDGIDALCPGRARRVPALGSRFSPSSRLGRLTTRLDPEQLVKSWTPAATWLPDLTTAGDCFGLNRTFELAMPTAAFIRPSRCSGLSEMSSSRSRRADFSPRRCRSSSSGDASSTRSSSSTATASCSSKQRARNTSHFWTSAFASFALSAISPIFVLLFDLVREISELTQRVALGLMNRLSRALHLRPGDLRDPTHRLADTHCLPDRETTPSRRASTWFVWARRTWSSFRRSWRGSR